MLGPMLADRPERIADGARAWLVFGEWLILAICSGLILGAASRVAMRVVALEANERVGFSVGGSVEVVGFGVLVGAPVAIVFWICRSWRPLPLGSGLVVAAVLFTILALVPPPAAKSALDAMNDTPIATAFAFAAAFALYGVALELFWYWTRSGRRPERSSLPKAGLGGSLGRR